MAATNHERVGRALELLKAGLGPFVEREFENAFKDRARAQAAMYLGEDRLQAGKPISQWDVAALIKVMWDSWNDVFRRVLGPAERSLLSELKDHRNKWAHQQSFSSDDSYRCLDSAGRLLTAISAPQSDEIEKAKMELLRLRFDEQVRTEKRKTAGAVIESASAVALKPWREVVTPHKDVASGRYQQAEFAADLWQVHLGEGTDEYRNPVEFFRRTYLTQSLKGLLVNALNRVSGGGGDPVVQLQTNFGGGKTHSMLALYHLFSGSAAAELTGVDGVMDEAGLARLPTARRVVLVGNKISPGNPVRKSDGTVVRTLWGELAWQLGFAAGGAKEAKKAYARIAADDEKATSPGDVLRDLFKEYGPCLVLVDEWVAYARQLHDQSDLPAGSFETQFTFAQVLTESAKLVKNCLLVISLPASDTSGSPQAPVNDVEVGGQRGREALDRLRNVIGRVESSWRPASAEEGFEIVRRRLFQPLSDPGQFKDRDVVARTFADLYRTQPDEFPPECRDIDYEKRLKAAYPIHPEVFDRLYTDWSTLIKFQRTRGVLRLMAAVIHSLWEKGDRNPLILPASIPIEDSRVQFELTRYLSDNWVPILEKDVDGPNSLPWQLDGQVTNLGKFSACRRVARTIYLGSAPTPSAANRGLEDRRVKLGCVMPGESPPIFGDALRRLAATATFLYQDGPRYWYSTQPTVTKLAEDRAEQLKRDRDKVVQEIEKRLRADLRRPGDFPRVQALPQSTVSTVSSAEVPDELEARLVVLGVDQPYAKEPGNAAETAARSILATRGNTPRLYQNMLVFLAGDRTRLQDLEDAARRFLAWESIVDEREKLDLTPQQAKQAETQQRAAEDTVTARIPETYQWLLVPTQASPQAPMELTPVRLTGSDALAVRASRKMKNDEMLVVQYAGTMLRKAMDDVPLWRGDHVSVRQLTDDFGRYVYLPRLRDPEVLTAAATDGLTRLTWNPETFAYADAWDEKKGTYAGLRGGEAVRVTVGAPGLLVRPGIAAQHIEFRRPPETPTEPGEEDTRRHETTDAPFPAEPPPLVLRRFHGSVSLDPDRLGRDAGRIAEEVVQHLATQKAAQVSVTLEIVAEIPGGAPDGIVRIVTENARALKFTTQGFEER
jgi:predicted AAA+ superfamily ATPase